LERSKRDPVPREQERMWHRHVDYDCGPTESLALGSKHRRHPQQTPTRDRHTVGLQKIQYSLPTVVRADEDKYPQRYVIDPMVSNTRQQGPSPTA
jgi:hypothetical protein